LQNDNALNASSMITRHNSPWEKACDNPTWFKTVFYIFIPGSGLHCRKKIKLNESEYKTAVCWH